LILEKDTSWKDKTKLELQDIVMLMETCMDGNFFEFENQFYEQKEGATMGSPISPCFAEFLMQDLEETLIPSMQFVQVYARYVDDIFSIVKKSEINNILQQLNIYHDEIQFSCEIMNNNQLLFLDCMIDIKEDFSLGFTVYRKPTSTDKFLNINSNHPTCHKLSVVDSLVNRAYRICDEDKIAQEISHISKILQLNNYPTNLIQHRIDRIKEHINNPPVVPMIQIDDSSRFLRRVMIPFIGTISTKIAHCIRRTTDIEICYKPINKLSTILNNKKHTAKEKFGIYKFTCSDCPKIYIGETGRNIQIREKEHLNDIRCKKATSGPYSHIRENPSHSFGPNTISLIEEERRSFPRKFKEALYILKSKDYNCNQEEGIKISPLWTALLLKNMKSP